MNLKFRQLEAFRAVINSGSTQRAAKQLFVTQPAISRLIKDLETELGFALFDRSQGKLALTTQGDLFFKSLEIHFFGLERLSQAADAIRLGAVKKITIACSPVLSVTILPPCIVDIQKHFPDVQIEVHTTELSTINQLLQRGLADMALCIEFPVPTGVASELLGQQDAVCAMPEQHRLAQKAQVSLDDLRGESMIEWLPINPFVDSVEQELLKQHGIAAQNRLKTQTANTRYALIAAGLGVSIAEPFAAAHWRGLGVVTRPLTPTVQFGYVLAYQKASADSEFTRTVIQIIKSHYQRFTQRI